MYKNTDLFHTFIFQGRQPTVRGVDDAQGLQSSLHHSNFFVTESFQ